MAAPETHPREHVETIKRLLEHYEEGFAFIKELVQNADDALKDSVESGRLHLQWHLPLTNSGFENPLLQGPALIVVNDGPFTKRDRDGLMRMGMGSKAGDDDRIGRFGLGMKAVFHVCEAFFFLEVAATQLCANSSALGIPINTRSGISTANHLIGKPLTIRCGTWCRTSRNGLPSGSR